MKPSIKIEAGDVLNIAGELFKVETIPEQDDPGIPHMRLSPIKRDGRIISLPGESIFIGIMKVRPL